MPITLILKSPHDPLSKASLRNFESLDVIKEVLFWEEGASLLGTIEKIRTEFFLIYLPSKGPIKISSENLINLVLKAKREEAGIVYSDYKIDGRNVRLCDYKIGSARDDFDFGCLMLFSTQKVKEVVKKYPKRVNFRFGELYDLRLKISENYPIIHFKYPSYEVPLQKSAFNEETIFSYVDPKNFFYQKEMESIFTEHLKRIGAYIPPHLLKSFEDSQDSVSASVVIPVKNREKTIKDALLSAIRQKTDFPFNIIVVDNHSDDRTKEIISEVGEIYANIIRIVPERNDLKIGGCWNEAIRSPFCGRYVIQLDSDDLYSREDTLQMIVDKFREGKYAMVVGSYMTVDFDLNPVYPGIVDHREWSKDNGHNNLLRVSGIGAPRAFEREVLLRIPFRDLDYGEDYDISLRISRKYKVGRIFDVLYLARRWEGGTDHLLNDEKLWRLNEIKDSIRTEEILGRIDYLRSLS